MKKANVLTPMTMDARAFPREIDGARILYAADIKMPDTTSGKSPPVVCFAAARYPDEKGFSLLYLDAKFRLVGDLYFDTLGELMDVLECEEEITDGDWRAIAANGILRRYPKPTRRQRQRNRKALCPCPCSMNCLGHKT